jgi:outer membrane protein assembly factor BamB
MAWASTARSRASVLFHCLVLLGTCLTLAEAGASVTPAAAARPPAAPRVLPSMERASALPATPSNIFLPFLGSAKQPGWPMFQQNARRTGAAGRLLGVNATAVISGSAPTMQWRYTAGGNVTFPAIASDGTLYFGSTDHNLYAINVNGGLKWSYTADDEILRGPALAPDGTIYFGTFGSTANDPALYALHPDGTLKWKYVVAHDESTRLYAFPAILPDGTIYFVSTSPDVLYALNANGGLNWQYTLSATTQYLPAVGPDGTIYVNDTSSDLYAISSSGALSWTYHLSSDTVNHTPLIGADGTIYTGGGDSSAGPTALLAINPDGSLKWSHDFGTEGTAPAALAADGTIYVSTYQAGVVYALSPGNTILWHSKVDTLAGLDPNFTIGVDGVIYAGEYKSLLAGEFVTRLYALNPDGSPGWTYTIDAPGDVGGIGWPPSIGADGTLYLPWEQYLYALR